MDARCRLGRSLALPEPREIILAAGGPSERGSPSSGEAGAARRVGFSLLFLGHPAATCIDIVENKR
jgi:hypothetical protein